MNTQDPKNHQEIIIVRRNMYDDDENVHGGAWKIAYADFVTAMMAFFLVMWLINVTSDETKITIASYFNPIKFSQVGDNPLSDNANIDKPDVPAKTRKNKIEGPLKEEKNRPSHSEDDATDSGVSEEQMMLNPYAALNEIATGKKDNQHGAGDDSSKVNTVKGQAFRDFIIPEYSIVNSEQAKENLGKMQKAKEGESDTSLEDALKVLAGGRSVITYDHAPTNEDTTRRGDNVGADKGTGTQKIEEEKQQILAKLNKDMAKIVQTAQQSNSFMPVVNLKAVKDGIEISLTDKAGFSMFDIGSSRPNKNLITFLTQVSKILQKTEGQLVIRGHTDARPYKNKHYDNWQLSLARAQMVYYMLIRGGFSPSRVASIEGYADRQLKNKANPNAAENRRIELLIRPKLAAQAPGKD